MKSVMNNIVGEIGQCKKGLRKDLVPKIIDSRLKRNSPTL